MRKFLLPAIAAITIAASSVFAADIPQRSPAPAPVETLPVFTWTGFYAGLNAGYVWSTNRHSSPTLLFGPAFANPKPTGFSLGGHFGYRHQYASGLVVGLEADGSWIAGKRGQSPFIVNLLGPAGANARNRLTWDAGIRAQLGYSMNRWLPYLTGGVAFVSEKGCGTIGAGCGLGATFSSTRTGWTIGAGVAYAVTNNWIANIEYRYANFGTKSHSTPGFGTGRISSKLDTHKVLIGLSYKFGGPAGSVVAKY